MCLQSGYDHVTHPPRDSRNSPTAAPLSNSMSLNVDIDEADVAVLTQNLAKSRELFNSISISLNKISTKADTALRKIKPVLTQVNRLTALKTEIEQGLALVAEVQQYAATAASLEAVLNAPIALAGLKKYLSTLIQSKKLLVDMKANVGKFKGVLVNFQNSIEKSEFGLITYFRRLLQQESVPQNLGPALRQQQQHQLEQHQQQPQLPRLPRLPQLQLRPQRVLELPRIDPAKAKELAYLFDYFYNLNPDDKSLAQIYIETRLAYLVGSMLSIDDATTPAKRQSRIPYERGSNGISAYSAVLTELMEVESAQIGDIKAKLLTKASQVADTNTMLFEIYGPVLNDKYSDQIGKIMRHVEANLATDSLLALESVVCVKNLELAIYRFINTTGITTRFKPLLANFLQLKRLCQTIFIDLLRYIEHKVSTMDKLPSDNGVLEVTVDLMSRVRKISDFRELCLEVVLSMKLGSWMMQTPKPKSITVFSSVLPAAPGSTADEHDANYLLLSYFSDCIDSILINLEIVVKQGELRIAKKSVQGYFLITNLTLVEQIVNRLSELYRILGPTGLERLNKLKKRFLVLFLDDWNYASYVIIRDMTAITATHATTSGTTTNSGAPLGLAQSLHTPNSKEREQIKELFKTFNESFEDAINSYKNFNITDQNLRAYLANEIKKLILNTYFKLYDKYGTSDFTKNKVKYVKYDKHSFEALLNKTL